MMSQLESPATIQFDNSPDVLSSKTEIHIPTVKEQRMHSPSAIEEKSSSAHKSVSSKTIPSKAADKHDSGRSADSSNTAAPATTENTVKTHNTSSKAHHPPLTISIDSGVSRFKRMKSFQRFFGASSPSMTASQTSSPSTAHPSPMFSLPSSCIDSSSYCTSPAGTLVSTPSIIRHYPPKPLQYSADISPAPELLKTRRSCTLRPSPSMAADYPGSQSRRSSAPQQQEARTLKRRMFSFLWS